MEGVDMRGFVLVLFAGVPLFGGTLDTSVTCNGVSNGVSYEGVLTVGAPRQQVHPPKRL